MLLTSQGSDPLYRRAIRVSMGTVFQVPWAYLPENVGLKDFLGQFGFKTAALALRNDTVSISDPKLLREEKLAVVLGTEGDGLAETTIAQCDYTVKIPMSHGVDSLNVAAASAVAFYRAGAFERLRRRGLNILKNIRRRLRRRTFYTFYSRVLAFMRF